MEPTAAELAPIRERYGQSLYLQAWQAAQTIGPLPNWSNTPARLLGGRLAIQLGAPRLGRWMHLQAFRNTPTYPEAIYYQARYRLEKFGPLATWQFLRRYPEAEWNEAPPDVRADWNGLHGFVAARLRDYDRAERWLNKAETIAPERPWLCIERAAAYEFGERYEEALVAARRSLELNPHFRPGLQAEAHILQMLGREQEAVERLEAVLPELESGILTAHLAALHLDAGRYADSRKLYDRYVELSPLLEPDILSWLAARRSDVSYFLGEWFTAKVEAEKTKKKEEFYHNFANRLGQLSPETLTTWQPKPDGARIREVEAIQSRLRNPQLTTFEVLSQFFAQATEEPFPTEGGGQDGLADVNEVLWASRNGYLAIEFAVSKSIAATLIERQLPFLITLVDAGYVHSQIVVGYDRNRDSLFLRDVADVRTQEAPWKTITERYASTGPRGLLLVPKSQADRIEGIEFPERESFEALHKLLVELKGYRRKEAVEMLNHRREVAPDHRLTHLMSLAVSRHDGNSAAILDAVNVIIDQVPDDATYLLVKIGALRDLGRKEDRLTLALEQLDRGEKGDPLFGQHYSQLLYPDPRMHAEGIQILNRAIRRRPHAAGGYYLLAGLLWEQRRFVEATDVYRFAASLEDREEQFSEGYFRAARVIGQGPEAMRFLQTRFQRTKGKLAAPGRAMFYALSEQEEMPSAFSVLEQSYRPLLDPETAATLTSSQKHELGELMLFAAEMRASYNEPELAEQLVAQAQPYALPATFRRTAARISLLKPDLVTARGYLEAAVADEPQAADVVRQLARVISDLEGRAATLTWLKSHCDRYSYCHPLQQLLIDWLRNDETDLPVEPPAAYVIQRLIDACPSDAWAYRELALHFASHGKTDEALSALQKARRLEPDCVSYYYTLGFVYQKADRIEEAKETYQQAMELSIDNDIAIGELLNLARGDEEREQVALEIQEEFNRQAYFGDGLLVFRDHAMGILDTEDLLKFFIELNAQHPECWQTWSVLIQQYNMSDQGEEAHRLAKEAVQEFPLVARLWVDLAEAAEVNEEQEERIEALKQAIRVAPGWSYAARVLAEALENGEQAEEAQVLLEQAVARNPLDPVNHGYLADIIWKQGEDPEGAIERLIQAVKLEPGYEGAWRFLIEWTEEHGEPERAIEVAREVTELKPGDPRAWLALVRFLNGPGQHVEALNALDKVIELQPRNIEAHDLKAEKLCEVGEIDLARQAAKPAVFENDPPIPLQGRAAWVEARGGDYETAIREMRAIVSIEPSFSWGWQQLAEWYNEVGDSENYLDAATKLVEARPDYPVALTMRGEAKLQTGDRDGAKEDLLEAHKAAPGFFMAGILLLDAYLADGQLDAARRVLAVMQEHTVGPTSAHLQARQVQLAVREKDEEAALEGFREICKIQTESTVPLSLSIQELRTANLIEPIDHILRESWSEEEFNPWTVIFWLEGPTAQQATLEDRIAALDHVLEKHPRFLQAHDVKIDYLGKLNRLEDAFAVCEDPRWGEFVPLQLRGRKAWLHSIAGDRVKAVTMMNELVRDFPDYYWGWQQLAAWLDAPETANEYLEASEQLVRLAPLNPTSYVCRGEARLFLGDRRNARIDFQKAFEIDPHYAFAGFHLFDEVLHDGDLETARKTLAVLQEHVDGASVHLRAVQLALETEDSDSVRSGLKKIFAEPRTPPRLAETALENLLEKNQVVIANDVLREVLDGDKVVPIAGRLWVQMRAREKDFSFLDQLPALMARNPQAGEEALIEAVDVLAVPSRQGFFEQLVKKLTPDLKKSDPAWAKVGEGFINLGMFELSVQWTDDWEKREIDKPWMLHPAALSRRLLGQYAEAYRISRKALACTNYDDTLGDFRIWAALEEALVGQTDAAMEHLEGLKPEDQPDASRILHQIAKALVDLQRTQMPARAETFIRLRDETQEIIEDLAPKQPNEDLSRTLRRWSIAFARAAGTWSAWFWKVGFRVRPWL
jgi:cellulose synthase operon protein C